MTDQEITEQERYDRAVNALLTEASPVLAESFVFSPGASVAATRIGIEALGYFGIGAEPVVVEGWIMNEYARVLIGEIGHYLTKNDKGYRQHVRAGYWLVTLGDYSAQTPADQWLGHLVIGTKDLLVDLLLGMIKDSPEDIDLAPASFARPEPHETVAGWDPPGGGRIIFQFRRQDFGYRDMPSWQRHRYRAITGRIIDRMKPHMTTEQEV